MNEPVPISDFGIFVNACANLYCKDKDGLELWLTMADKGSSEYLTMIEKYQNNTFSPYYTAFICASVAYLFFMFGYVLIRKVTKDEL